MSPQMTTARNMDRGHILRITKKQFPSSRARRRRCQVTTWALDTFSANLLATNVTHPLFNGLTAFLWVADIFAHQLSCVRSSSCISFFPALISRIDWFTKLQDWGETRRAKCRMQHSACWMRAIPSCLRVFKRCRTLAIEGLLGLENNGPGYTCPILHGNMEAMYKNWGRISISLNCDPVF